MSAFPRSFGPYVLVAELGRDERGEVYLAWSGQLADIAKLCVIKTLRPGVGDGEALHRRFLEEARILVSLGHANLCSVYDVGRVDETSYIAMEYVGRRTLRDVQERALELGVRLPSDVALWLVSCVLEGLEHAHSARDPISGEPLHIVHRAVSPRNVIVRHDGGVKLMDFGLARSSLVEERTQADLAAGRVTYMAPEQVRSEPLDGRADQFAAAVLLYELVMGERFYEGMREYRVWSLAASGTYRPRRWDAVPPELRTLLDVALAGDASQRFPSCEVFLEELSAVLGAARVSAERRFKDVMKELFPQGEEEERAFLQSLPARSAVRGLVRESSTPPEKAPPPSASPSPSSPLPSSSSSPPPRDEENTAALVARVKPRRWPLFAAAGLVGLLLVAIAAVFPRCGGEPTGGAPVGGEPP